VLAAAQMAGLDPLTGEAIDGVEPSPQAEVEPLTRAQSKLAKRGKKMFRGFDARRHVLPGEQAPLAHDLGPGARERRIRAEDELEPTAEYMDKLRADLAAPRKAPVEMMKAGGPRSTPPPVAGVPGPSGLTPISGYQTVLGDEDTASGHALRVALERINRR
jgi:hypothetical protein